MWLGLILLGSFGDGFAWNLWFVLSCVIDRVV